MAYYDPFAPISVKLLMLDHLNHYIYYPACWWLDTHLLHVSDRLAFITPDAISMSHVVVAAMGAKLIVSESLTQRRIGVVLFEIRYTGEEIFQCLIRVSSLRNIFLDSGPCSTLTTGWSPAPAAAQRP